jgi:CO/xanthine dehydrogenase FAD-binding subunit
VKFLQPGDISEALDLKSRHPEAVPLAGGTDLMVDLNFDRDRPRAIMDLGRVEELRGWERDDGAIVLGAGVTYTQLIDEVGGDLPGLRRASRTVGSPQIRNRGTLGGNLGTASAAGDALPPLLAAGARVDVASVRGHRRLRVEDFLVGPKQNALAPDELITSVRTHAARGPQQFCKIGTRNAMVIAVATFALALDPVGRSVGTGVGSAGPVTFRAKHAESFMGAVLEEQQLWDSRAPLPESAAERFGALVAEAASPIDDVRGTAAYRRHALTVVARRALTWAWDEYGGRS